MSGELFVSPLEKCGNRETWLYHLCAIWFNWYDILQPLIFSFTDYIINYAHGFAGLCIVAYHQSLMDARDEFTHIFQGCFTGTGAIVRLPQCQWSYPDHYGDVIMGAIASQITSLTIVYSTVYSDADQRKHQSSALLAFVRGIHRWPVNSPHKGPVRQKMFPFDDAIMCYG